MVRQILTVCKTAQCGKFIKSLYNLMHFSLFYYTIKKIANPVFSPSITLPLETSLCHPLVHLHPVPLAKRILRTSFTVGM